MEKHQLIERLLTLQNFSPFILICDTLSQTADALVETIAKRARKDAEYIVETQWSENQDEIVKQVNALMSPDRTLIGVFHTDIPSVEATPSSPSVLNLLEYMATSVIRIIPSAEASARLAESPFNIFDRSGSVYNQPQFTIEVEHRRKSGRTVRALFHVDSEAATFKQADLNAVAEQIDMSNLTTFNLQLSEKQRADRDEVELPYIPAQRGEAGGAILYEYTEVDDYDEDEPFEEDYV